MIIRKPSLCYKAIQKSEEILSLPRTLLENALETESLVSGWVCNPRNSPSEVQAAQLFTAALA